MNNNCQQNQKSESIYTCPYCSFAFSSPLNSYCSNCPLYKGCDLIKCPNCGYEFPDITKGLTGKIYSLYKKLLKNQKQNTKNLHR